MYHYSVVGLYMVAQQPLLVHLLGLGRFASSFSLLILFTGAAALVCQPLAGQSVLLLVFTSTCLLAACRSVSSLTSVY